GLPASQLCLEITESVLLEDASASARALAALKDLGVRISVDDFGTGYSSLTYLQRFPVDTPTVDRSVVSRLAADRGPRRDRAIVAGVIDLAHAFGLTTIAEGVETEAQLTVLRSLGCEQAQGYLWSTPIPADDALRLILGWATERASGSARPVGLRPVSVLVVDDQISVRRVITDTLALEEDLCVVGEASDGRQAIALARHHQPDVVVLDLAMPGMGGLEALPLLLAVAPRARVV